MGRSHVWGQRSEEYVEPRPMNWGDNLTLVGAHSPDVIITDINMPRLDGFGFIERVRQDAVHRATPILVLTTESDPSKKDRARSAGATGWIVKPFDPEKLISVIHRVVH